jgi:hypoxanthine phosphoribosyltransferase
VSPKDSGSARRLIGADELRQRVAGLGSEISASYPDGVVLIGVLKGSVCFLADLLRTLTVPCEVDFLAISAYTEGTGRVRIVKDLESDIFGRDVVLVEDVVDTGLTLTYVTGELERRGPRSLAVCALLDKQVRRLVPTPVRFRGFEVQDEFVIGYGLDFAERYRNLEAVFSGDLGVLGEDPDAYVEQFFGG